ncbi:MAG: ATP-binding cassette domain-containing protein [Gemmatimonadota bacterium]|nr:ATP-binding cassette domain-containing protein [Gemmatimonadota bacterium]MDH3426819.1 ATP-binding cassette domain-containing protein [Gemmatimonadota bacterium]
MISVSGLAKSFGVQTLFENATFQLNAGSCYGLVGANGSGKTTLLNILAGEEDPTAGSVSIPKKLRLGVLRQDQFLYETQQVLEVAMMGHRELWEAMAAKERLLEAPAEEFDAHRFAELEETIQRHDGYSAEARAAEILEGLGFPTEVHRHPLSTLSGGFKLRVLLAQTLAGSPDVLLLDEPTNHLDILSIRWLEKFLAKFPGPIVVISHDHRFLDNVSSHILDVDYETVTLYHGDYAHFQRAKVEERERREKEITEREREITHHQQFVDRFRAKASKARQAQSKLRLIEKKADSLESLPPSSRRYPRFHFEPRRPSGREVLKVDAVRKAFGDNEVLHGVNLELRRGDRLAIMGPNGIGKSTLLKIVMGVLPADEGTVEWGYEAHPGYFAQDHHEQFESPAWTAEEWIAASCPGSTKGFIRGELGRLLFSGDEAEKSLGALSGGEAARLVFCRLAIQKPNVLVLDEPTNHLDLEAIEALVESLRSYDGTLVFVSHDRWFVSRLATRIIEIKPDGMFDFDGTYEQYVHACGDDHLDVDTVVLKARVKKRTVRQAQKAVRESGDKAAGPKALRQRREQITSEIEAGESRLRDIDAEFSDPKFYERSSPEAVRMLEDERAALDSRLAELMAEWEAVEEELADYA